MYGSDKPISKSEQDFLNRSDFAINFAQSLMKYDKRDCLTVSLLGEWGSGKTSIINMVQEHIENSEESKMKITHFRPWLISEQHKLVEYFLNQLSNEIGHGDSNEDMRDLSIALKKYSKVLKPLSFVPQLNLAINGITAALDTSSTALDVVSEYDVCLDDVKIEIEDLLGKLDYKLLIVIDDIDRLTNSEIRKIFQLVKVIGDFSNIIYLLAFDKNIVGKSLGELQMGDGKLYLEKIIQIPVEVPSIRNYELQEFLFKSLNSVIVDIPDSDWDSSYWADIYNSGIRYLFSNIREVTRFINTLSFNYTIVKDKVSIIDFIAITALQIVEPDLYDGIRNNKEIFTEPFRDNRGNDVEIKIVRDICDGYGKACKKLEYDAYLDFMMRLFPKLKKVYKNTSFGGGFSSRWRRSARLCSKEHFDLYFGFVLPNGAISKSEMNALVNSMSNTDEFRVFLENIMRNSKIEHFLTNLEDYTLEAIAKENILNVITVLFEIGDFIPDNKKGMFEFRPSMKILRIVHQLVMRFKSKEERFKILFRAIELTHESIYTVVNNVAIQCQEHGKYDFNKESINIEGLTVSSDQLEKLEALVLEKLEDWKEVNSLIDHPKFLSMLYMWRRWDADGANGYVSEIIDDDSNLIKFVGHFVGESQSYSFDGYGVKSNLRLDYLELFKFIDKDETESRISILYPNIDLESFTKKQKHALDAINSNKYIDSKHF